MRPDDEARADQNNEEAPMKAFCRHRARDLQHLPLKSLDYLEKN
jgi:hypothetical protein